LDVLGKKPCVRRKESRFLPPQSAGSQGLSSGICFLLPLLNEVKNMIRKISGAFTGGAVGAFVYGINLWILAALGIINLIGTNMRPVFTASGFYQRMIWGGILMLPLVFPLWKSRIVFRGCIFSLLPSAVMLFVVFPRAGRGLMGTEFGLMTPFLVIALNFISGIVAAYWYKSAAH